MLHLLFIIGSVLAQITPGGVAGLNATATSTTLVNVTARPTQVCLGSTCSLFTFSASATRTFTGSSSSSSSPSSTSNFSSTYQPTSETTSTSQPSYSATSTSQPSYSPTSTSQPSYSPTSTSQPSYSATSTSQPTSEPTSTSQPSYSPTGTSQSSYSATSTSQPSYEPTSTPQPTSEPTNSTPTTTYSFTITSVPVIQQNQKTVRVQEELTKITNPLTYLSYRATYQCQLNTTPSFVWLSKIIPLIPNYTAILLYRTDSVNQQQINCSSTTKRSLQIINITYFADLIFTVDTITPVGMPLASMMPTDETPTPTFSLGIMIGIGGGSLAGIIILIIISGIYSVRMHKHDKNKKLILPIFNPLSVTHSQTKNLFIHVPVAGLVKAPSFHSDANTQTSHLASVV